MKTPQLHFEEAIAAILAESRPGERSEELPVAEAAGLALAEEIVSDIDVPAFDRAAMDGFAFRHADTGAPAMKEGFLVAGTVAAGSGSVSASGSRALLAGECVKIMTGAPLPPGADTVVPVEDTSGYVPPGERVRFRAIPAAGSNMVPRGQSSRAGERVLRQGRLLAPSDIALLATAGRLRVRVQLGPRVAFGATGDELREPDETLPPGCIRNSNAYNLWSQIQIARAEPVYLGILPDRPAILRERIAFGLEHDILILSGGVSMGEFDFVPGILQELGVGLRFQKLFVRPGQPTVFGVRESAGRRTLVFGLPGNPISTLFAFDQYVAPAIRVFRRHPQPLATVYRGGLLESVRKRDGYLTLVPCVSAWREDHFELTPLRTHGSSDMAATRGIDAVGMLAAAGTEAPAGAVIPFRKLHEP